VLRASARCDGGARWWGEMAGGLVERVARLFADAVYCAPRRSLGDFALLAATGAKTTFSACVLACRSRTRTKFVQQAGWFCEKVIRRDMRGFPSRVAARSPLVTFRLRRGCLRRGAFALLHQPARQHCGGVLLKPGVQQLHDLLAEIGGVAEPRKLIALQGIARRREKELPGRLGFVVQGDLQGKLRHGISRVNTVNSTHVPTYCGKMCKSFAWNRKHRSMAPSGCAGP
jgi:hypothetical protein